jgi:hypothetical protein
VARQRHHLLEGVVTISVRRLQLPKQHWERKFPWVYVSTKLASAGVISFLKAPLMHPRCSLCAIRCRASPLPLLVLLCLRCVSFCSVVALVPPAWLMVLSLLFAVVVVWSSPVTDVVLGSTSGGRRRECDAPRRCCVGSSERVVFWWTPVPPRLHLLSWRHCDIAPFFARLRCWVWWRVLSFFVHRVGCNHFLRGYLCRVVLYPPYFRPPFFSMKRHVKSCSRKNLFNYEYVIVIFIVLQN